VNEIENAQDASVYPGSTRKRLGIGLLSLVAALAIIIAFLATRPAQPAAAVTPSNESPVSFTPLDALIEQARTGDPAVLESFSNAELHSLVSRTAIVSLDYSITRTLGRIVASRALEKSRSPERFIADYLPSASEILAMLARDRDVDDFLENAADTGAAGTYYQHVADLVPEMKYLRSQYEGFFSGIFSVLEENNDLEAGEKVYPDSILYVKGVTLPRLSTKPRESEYDYSHTFALDIFLKDVEVNKHTGLEKGPVIFSLEKGLVIAADSSWKGGDDLSEYVAGGITPKAGNGVIVFSPRKRRFYLYFHLNNVFPTEGAAIPAGFPLGHGGNTGTNARKPGHGEHLHLEIFDLEAGKFLRNYQIADIVFD